MRRSATPVKKCRLIITRLSACQQPLAKLRRAAISGTGRRLLWLNNRQRHAVLMAMLLRVAAMRLIVWTVVVNRGAAFDRLACD